MSYNEETNENESIFGHFHCISMEEDKSLELPKSIKEALQKHAEKKPSEKSNPPNLDEKNNNSVSIAKSDDNNN